MGRNIVRPGTPMYDIYQYMQELVSVAGTHPELAVSRAKAFIRDYELDPKIAKRIQIFITNMDKALETGEGLGIKPKVQLDRTIEDPETGVFGGPKDLETAMDTGQGYDVSDTRGEAVQNVLLKHMLAWMGMSASTGGGRSYMDARIETMGTLMNEDGTYDVTWTRELYALIENANQLGFAVASLEPEVDLDMGYEGDDDIMGFRGESPEAGVEPGLESENDPVTELVNWAEQNGAPPELCDRVRATTQPDQEMPEEPIEPIEAPEMQPEAPPPEALPQM